MTAGVLPQMFWGVSTAYVPPNTPQIFWVGLTGGRSLSLPLPRGRPSRDRRIARESPDDRGLSRRRSSRVESSIGHVRDLEPKGLGIDVDHGFKPTYVVHANKRDVLKRLRAALKDADELYLATDEDREGEAISWHLLQELKPVVPVKRMVFHEITPRRHRARRRELARHRLRPGRRAGDPAHRRSPVRLPGVEVLWRKVNRGLSAGRVQSPAVRLVVERERERIAFVAAGYWDLAAAFPTAPAFTATLVGARGPQGRLRPGLRRRRPHDRATSSVLDEPAARNCVDALDGRDVRRAHGRGEAVPVFAQAAVHDLDPAAGGRPQAAHELGRR